MSHEMIDEEPLLPEEFPETEVTTSNRVAEFLKRQNWICIGAIVAVSVAVLILVIGLSVGLTHNKKKPVPDQDPEHNPTTGPSYSYTSSNPPTIQPYPTRTPFPTAPSQYPTQTSSPSQSAYIPTQIVVPTPTPVYTPDVLPGCQIYPAMECEGSTGAMNEKYTNHTWHTPTRGSIGWNPGFQDMSVLTGYAQLKYTSGRKGCTVNIVTKTKKTLSLKYYFDGVSQTTPEKTFDSTYTGILKVKIVATTGESLELDDIDFIWNSQPLLARSGDYRNGQKGAIVEMFGWPDEDVEKECKHLAEAGYLGIKLFPHQEQLMGDQPDQGALNPWYWMYQPVSYKLNGRMGSRATLRRLIKTCRSHGLRVYADAVANHMAAGGNDILQHRNPSSGCTTWGGKFSSAGNESFSPFYTPAWTYQKNQRGEPDNVLEFPAVPYGPMDFHCNKGVTSWSDANILNTGWLVGLSDLDTSKDYVRQRICDYFVDLLSIGFSGFRIDAAKHIHPDDLSVIFAKFKAAMGGSLPEDWITWLEVLTGGEAYLLVQDGSDYSFSTHFTQKLKEQGMTEEDILKIKIWWCGYPSEPGNDNGSLDQRRKVIQNDDHDQQNPGSSSRDMHDEGCVLVKGCAPATHRAFEVKMFSNPNGASDNDNHYPIRLILSSYYFINDVMSIPDGLSDCALCKKDCNTCKSRSKVQAYQENAQPYSGSGYTYVHRDTEIINAMRKWIHL